MIRARLLAHLKNLQQRFPALAEVEVVTFQLGTTFIVRSFRRKPGPES
jgi:hypothetical protein